MKETGQNHKSGVGGQFREVPVAEPRVLHCFHNHWFLKLSVRASIY